MGREEKKRRVKYWKRRKREDGYIWEEKETREGLHMRREEKK